MSTPALPAVIARYQDAHDRRDTDVAIATFTADAHVADDGHDYRGTEQLRGWLSDAASEYTFTRTLVGADAVAADTWVVTNHVAGNFPGGEVDLRYRFVLAGDLIAELVIAP